MTSRAVRALFSLPLLYFSTTALLAEESVTIPKDHRIGPPLARGIRDCYRALGVTGRPAGIQELSYRSFEAGEEPVLMAYDLENSAQKKTKGFFVYSEKGTLYFPLPAKPSYQRKDTETNVWYLEFERVPGFSKELDKDYYREKEALLRREHTAQFVLQENPKGAQEYYSEGDPKYDGPMFLTSNWWLHDKHPLQKVRAIEMPKDKDAESTIIQKIEGAIRNQVRDRMEWIDGNWAKKVWTSRDIGPEDLYKRMVLRGNQELQEKLSVCATTDNRVLTASAKELLALLKKKTAAIEGELIALTDSKERAVPRIRRQLTGESDPHETQSPVEAGLDLFDVSPGGRFCPSCQRK